MKKSAMLRIIFEKYFMLDHFKLQHQVIFCFRSGQFFTNKYLQYNAKHSSVRKSQQ